MSASNRKRRTAAARRRPDSGRPVCHTAHLRWPSELELLSDLNDQHWSMIRNVGLDAGLAKRYARQLHEGMHPTDRDSVAHEVMLRAVVTVAICTRRGMPPSELAGMVRTRSGADALSLLHQLLRGCAREIPTLATPEWTAELDRLPPPAPVATADVHGLATVLALAGALVAVVVSLGELVCVGTPVAPPTRPPSTPRSGGAGR